MAAGPHPLPAELLDEAVGAPLGAHEHERLGRRPGRWRPPPSPCPSGGPAGSGAPSTRRWRVTDATSWRTGSCRWRFTTRSTSPSRVAENSMRLVATLDPAQHPLDLGQEAHVGHAVGLVEHDDLDVGQRHARRSVRSISRPGVAMTTSTPLWSFLIWRSMSAPP